MCLERGLNLPSQPAICELELFSVSLSVDVCPLNCPVTDVCGFSFLTTSSNLDNR